MIQTAYEEDKIMLKIIVLIKQVPGTQKVQVDPKTGSLIRKGFENITNPDDLHGLELALQLKDKYGADITVISMGPLQAKDSLYEAQSLGADSAVLVSDPSLSGSDTWVTSKVLVKAIEKIGKFDLIICGVEAIDGNTGQVPYQISESLKIPLITQINEIKLEDAEKSDEIKSFFIDRIKGHEKQQIRVRTPFLITANKYLNEIRFPNLLNVKKALEKQIKVWTCEDIAIKSEETGLKGSLTEVILMDVVSHKRKNEIIEGSLSDISKKIIEILRNANLFTKIK